MKNLRKLIRIENDPEESRYPQVKELFNLVRNVIIRIMEVKDPIQLRDSEIGKLVGIGPDETSRWKHGKRRFDSCERLMQLQEKLDIDEYLLIGVATGRMKADEAFKIWELGFELKDKCRKESLVNYLKEKKIPYKLVILNTEE